MNEKQIRLLKIIIPAAIAAIALITLIVVIVVNAKKKNEVKEPRVITISIDAPDDIPLEEKERIIYQSLIKAGYSPAGACGIMGNIAVESPDFDPVAVN